MALDGAQNIRRGRGPAVSAMLSSFKRTVDYIIEVYHNWFGLNRGFQGPLVICRMKLTAAL